MPKVNVREAKAQFSKLLMPLESLPPREGGWLAGKLGKKLAVAMLLVGVGCPSEFGINGRIDSAMRHDQAQEDCPPHTHRKFRSQACTNPGCPAECVAD
jgi:hypothetical protein